MKRKVNLSAPRPEGRGLLKVHPEPRFATPPSKTGLRAVEWVKFQYIALGVISLVSMGLYLNTLHHPFLFDDHPNILDNPYIRNLSDLPLFLRGVQSYTGIPRALTSLSFALNYHFHRFDVLGYHIVNLLLHILSGILVFFIGRTLFLLELGKNVTLADSQEPDGRLIADLLSFLSALVFVSHPLQVNTVTYLAQRTEGLASFFYLLCLHLFMSGSFRKGWEKILFFAGTGFFFICAVFSKETGFTIPIVLVLFDYVFVCKTRGDRIKRLRIYLPLLILLVLYLLFFLRGGVFNLLLKRTREGEMAPWHYLLTQANVIVQYLKLLVLPLPRWLSIDHDFPFFKSFLQYPTFLSFSLLVLLLLAGAWLMKKRKLISFCIFFFFIVLAPSSSIIPLWDFMVEYRLYLPVLSYSLILTFGIYSLCRFLLRHCPRAVGLGVTLGICLLLLTSYSWVTLERNRVFYDPLTLWKDAAVKSPGKMRVHHNLGKAYFEKGKIDQAIQEGEIALQLSAKLDRKENVKFVLNLLGGSYLLKGDTQRAIEMLHRAIEVDSNYATSYYNLSCVHATRKEKEKALEYLKKAITLDRKYKEKARTDKDLVPIRDLKEFNELVT